MLYRRSSFISWLTNTMHCEVIPLRDSMGLVVKNGPMSMKLWYDKNDLIDYEEIYLVYKKLLLTALPGEKDLIAVR